MALSYTGAFPATYGLFTSNFKQPAIPEVATELHGFFLQHKWDEIVSHISSGYWYNSAGNGKVRIDETYAGAYGSSLFDYTNSSSSGGISNRQIIVSPSVGSPPECFNEYVSNPGFPLITADLLKSNNATFGGIVKEPFLGDVQTWNLIYASIIPVTAYLNRADPPVLMGYDFFGVERRTKVETRFFAHEVGNISAEVFKQFPC